MSGKGNYVDPLALISKKVEGENNEGNSQEATPAAPAKTTTKKAAAKADANPKPQANPGVQTPPEPTTKKKKGKQSIEELVKNYEPADDRRESFYLYRKDRDLLKALSVKLNCSMQDLNAAIINNVLRDVNRDEVNEILDRGRSEFM